MARAGETSRSAAAIRGGGGVAIAVLVMNVTTYGFTIACAHILGPTDYGALAAWMNLLMVVNVGFLGLQATAARRLSSGEHSLDDVEPHLVRLTLVTALTLGVVLLALTPVINVTLQLHNTLMAALLGLSAIPLTIAGGSRASSRANGAGAPSRRSTSASALPGWCSGWRSPSGAPSPCGQRSGSPSPCWHRSRSACTRCGTGISRARRAGVGLGSLVREMGHNSQALLAFFAVSNVDLIVARHTLSPHDAGLYAAGLILTKAVLFLPQFVSVVAFPSMAADDSSRTFNLAVLSVAGLGALATLATALLPGLALIFVGGAEYDDLRSQLWIFAVLGTVLACLMMVVYGLIARGGSRAVYLTWVGLVAIVALGLSVDTIPGLLSVVLGVDSALVVVLLIAHQRTAPSVSSDTAAQAVEGFPAQ